MWEYRYYVCLCVGVTYIDGARNVLDIGHCVGGVLVGRPEKANRVFRGRQSDLERQTGPLKSKQGEITLVWAGRRKGKVR